MHSGERDSIPRCAQSYQIREKWGSTDEAAKSTRLILFSKWLDQEFSAYSFNATTRNMNHDFVQETDIERAHREYDNCGTEEAIRKQNTKCGGYLFATKRDKFTAWQGTPRP